MGLQTDLTVFYRQKLSEARQKIREMETVCEELEASLAYISGAVAAMQTSLISAPAVRTIITATKAINNEKGWLHKQPTYPDQSNPRTLHHSIR